MRATARQIRIPAFKVWFETRGRHTIGAGGAALLQAIREEGSITKAAKKLGISYKYAWDQISEMEKALGQPILETKVGGRTGGGAALNDVAISLLREYSRTRLYVENMLRDREHWEAIGLKLSARNRLKGVVKRVEKGSVTTSIKIEVKSPVVVTAIITKEAAEELDIKPGDIVEAIVKATEVMVAKE